MRVLVLAGLVKGDAPADNAGDAETVVEIIDLPDAEDAGVPETDNDKLAAGLPDTDAVILLAGLPDTDAVVLLAGLPDIDELPLPAGLPVTELDALPDDDALPVAVPVGLPVPAGEGAGVPAGDCVTVLAGVGSGHVWHPPLWQIGLQTSVQQLANPRRCTKTTDAGEPGVEETTETETRANQDARAAVMARMKATRDARAPPPLHNIHRVRREASEFAGLSRRNTMSRVHEQTTGTTMGLHTAAHTTLPRHCSCNITCTRLKPQPNF